MLRLENGADVEVVREGVCFRPTSSTGRPVGGRGAKKNIAKIATQYIARILDEALAADCGFQIGGGVWVSAGHGMSSAHQAVL